MERLGPVTRRIAERAMLQALSVFTALKTDIGVMTARLLLQIGRVGRTVGRISRNLRAQAVVTTANNVLWMVEPQPSAMGSCGADHEVSVWTVDSGCSSHVTGNRDLFISYTEFGPGEHQVRTANGQILDATGRGDITMPVWKPGGDSAQMATVQSVLHVPGCPESFLSVSQLGQVGIGRTFGTGIGRVGAVMFRNGKCIVEMVRVKGLYVVRSGRQLPVAVASGTQMDTMASLCDFPMIAAQVLVPGQPKIRMAAIAWGREATPEPVTVLT
jgi:hypothetical protein